MIFKGLAGFWPGAHAPRTCRRHRAAQNALRISGLLLAFTGMLCSGNAYALPSFAVQTGQPCAACHVGAYGPQLRGTGRDFKLFGFVNDGGNTDNIPLSLEAQASFTHTNADQSGGAAPGFGPNNNFAFDQLMGYWGGRITSSIGAFAQITFDGVAKTLSWDNIDIRYAHESSLLGHDVVYGVTLNNNPTVSDLWNSTPAWGFPYNSSALAPSPATATLIDGSLYGSVVGAGVYSMWDEWVYVETALYRGLGRDVRHAVGVVPVSGTNSYSGVLPYWRLAIQHDFGNHYFEFGTYGIHGNVIPGGTKGFGSDGITDLALDANYQYTMDVDKVVADMLSAHATYIKQQSDLTASYALGSSTNLKNHLDTFRADMSYSIGATYTPSIQYFQTRGNADSQYVATPSGSPNSRGMVVELAYVPWGKPDSGQHWYNARLSLQYVAYSEFDGSSIGASKNNTIYLNLWMAVAQP